MSEVSELLRDRTNVANKDVKGATSAKSFYAVGCAHLQSADGMLQFLSVLN